MELTENILAQAIGLASAIFSIIATQQKEKKSILRYSGAGCILISVNLFLLGGVLSAGVSLLAGVRNFIVATDFGERAKNYIIPTSLLIILAATFYNGITDWQQSFIILGPIFGSFAYSQNTLFKIHGYLFLCKGTWLINALMLGSIGGILVGLIVTSGHFFTITRHCRENMVEAARKIRKTFSPRPTTA